MGNWTVVIHGTGAHHNLKKIDANRLVPDGNGDYERNCYNADYAAARFVRELKENGQTITAATFTSGGMNDLDRYRNVLKAEV